MSSHRTIFLRNGVPIEEKTPLAKKWVSVCILEHEMSLYPDCDAELISLVLSSINTGKYELGGNPKQVNLPLWVSFPIPDDGTLLDVINQLKLNYLSLAAGLISIDREYTKNR